MAANPKQPQWGEGDLTGILGPLDPDKRVFKDVSVDKLVVARDHQRDLNQENVSKMAYEWDWIKAECPTCVRLGNGLYRVIEGQHRVSALRLRDKNAKIHIAVVGVKLADSEESGYGVEIARSRRGHSKLAQWEARVRRGDKHELAAEEVLRKHGLRLGMQVGVSTIASVAVVEQIVKDARQTPSAGAKTLDTTLTTIEMAYERDSSDSSSTRWHGEIIKAVGTLVLRNPQVECDRLAMTLQEKMAKHWITHSKSLSEPRAVWFTIADMVAQRYNKGIRNAKRKIYI